MEWGQIPIYVEGKIYMITQEVGELIRVDLKENGDDLKVSMVKISNLD